MLRGKGLLEEDNGATIMWCGPKYQIPLMVRKSDGGYGYDSTDLAAVRYRLEELERDWVIYITDAGQAMHFHMIFDAARLVGWAQDERHRLDHVGFGVVQGEDGKRFKTRSGDTVRLVDLLDEGVVRMSASLLERIKDGKTALTEAEAKEAAQALGYGAVKYADLKQNPTTDYQFSYDRCVFDWVRRRSVDGRAVVSLICVMHAQQDAGHQGRHGHLPPLHLRALPLHPAQGRGGEGHRRQGARGGRRRRARAGGE